MTRFRRWIGSHNHLVQGWLWVALGIPTLIWWKDSILWVALMSIYANSEASFSAHEAQKDVTVRPPWVDDLLDELRLHNDREQ